MKVLVLVLDHKVLVLVLNLWSWSWSRSWRKSHAVFQDFCCNSWQQWARLAMAFCERQQKQFAIRKPLFERTFCAPCTSASVERVFNNGCYLFDHSDDNKAHCIDCGKLLSLGSNKPGKQTVHGLKCPLEKCDKYIYTLYMRKVESRHQGPPAKRRNWTRYWWRIVRAYLVTECMKRKKNTNIIGWLSFSFFGRKWMSIFVFGHKWNFIFVGIFVYGRKWQMPFGRRPLVYITKRFWSWDAKSWS